MTEGRERQDLISENPDQPITLTAAQLQQMLFDVQRGGGLLPPGAVRAEDGTVYRTVRQPTGRRRAVKDASGKVIREETVSRLVRRGVYLTYDFSPEGLVRAKRQAQASGLDFYHPRYGWLRNGSKREVEVAENLGSGAELYEMVYEPVEEPDDQYGPSVVASGVDAATSASVPDAGEIVEYEESSSSGLASWDDALTAQGDPPKEGRPKKG
jgi:hypothetical protein